MVASTQTLRPGRCEQSCFVDTMSRAVNGVSIITTDGPHGKFGLTVSSMTSVSASPPMLLVCINRASIAHDAMRDNERFAINLLASHQHRIANQFAGISGSDDRFTFDSINWATDTYLPRLLGAAAYFECQLVSAMTFGSHSVLIGEVVDACPGEDTPLLYTGRSYGRPVCLN